MTKPTVGTLLTPVTWKASRCTPLTIDARQAAAEAVGAYLMGASFVLDNGTDIYKPTTEFQLRQVLRQWPEADTKLLYPCASIIDFGENAFQASNLTPVCLEDTWNVFGPNTALFKTSELVGDFQVDFWANDKPTREAIAAALPALFSPGDTYGAEISCSERYWSSSVRASMLGSVREDDSATAYSREWRLRTTIRVEIPVLDLRTIPRADFSAKVAEIGPTVVTSADVAKSCQ